MGVRSFAFAFLMLAANGAWSAECTKMMVSGNEEYPPNSWRDKQNPDKLIGAAIEVIEMAMKDTGVKVETKYMGTWKQFHDGAKRGSVDVMAGGYINDERKTYLEYVSPAYYMDPTVLFVKKGKAFPFSKKEDLVGRKGAQHIGESFGQDFDAYAKANLKIEHLQTNQLAFDRLLGGDVDYVLGGLYPLLAVAEIEGWRDRLEHLPKEVVSEGMYIAITKSSPCVKYKELLEKKIAQYVKDGTSQRLLDKYLVVWGEQTKVKKK